MIKKIIWFFQKIFKGYSVSDLWNLDFHLAKIIFKRLKAFKKLERFGYPAGIKSFKEWNEILDKMIFSFEFVISNFGTEENYKWHDEIWEKLEKKEVSLTIGNKKIYTDRKYNKEKCKEYYKKYTEGMTLFSEHFHNLWD